MNNQKGEATLFCILILVALSGLLTLCGLELHKNFSLLKKRTNLFLCVKEAKGELNLYLISMGRLNWVLKNVTKAQMAAVFIPPLWPYVAETEKLKKTVKILQAGTLPLYLAQLNRLRNKGCALDPRMFQTPYKLGKDWGYEREAAGNAKLRGKEWTYYFLDKPYLLTLKVNAWKAESLMPKIEFQAEEKMGTLSSLLSSR